jgi:hypothetical protein
MAKQRLDLILEVQQFLENTIKGVAGFNNIVEAELRLIEATAKVNREGKNLGNVLKFVDKQGRIYTATVKRLKNAYAITTVALKEGEDALKRQVATQKAQQGISNKILRIKEAELRLSARFKEAERVDKENRKRQEQQNLINKVIRIKTAEAAMTKRFKEVERLERENQKRREQQALINKILRIKEAERQATKRMADEEARLAKIQAKRQASYRREQAEGAIRRIRGPITGATVAATGATEQEIVNLRAAESNIKELILKHNLAKARVLAIWRDVAAGRIKAHTGVNRKIQAELLKLKRRYGELGNAALKAAEQERKARERAGAAAQRANTHTTDGIKKVKAFELTWTSLVRLLSAQVIYRAVFGLASQLQEAFNTVRQLQVALAEIQTISAPTESFENWQKVVKDLSDEFGLDILDTAEAAYQSLSNQIIDTSDQFAVFGRAMAQK